MTTRPSTHPCTMPGCDGQVYISPFLIPTEEPNTLKAGYLWECNTCGHLWNLDGTPWHDPNKTGADQ